MSRTDALILAAAALAAWLILRPKRAAPLAVADVRDLWTREATAGSLDWDAA